jgi:hypothetical protein
MLVSSPRGQAAESPDISYGLPVPSKRLLLRPPWGPWSFTGLGSCMGPPQISGTPLGLWPQAYYYYYYYLAVVGIELRDSYFSYLLGRHSTT